MKAAVQVLGFFFFMSVAILFGGSCANIVPPGGGPRDSLAPALLSVTPRDSTLNFNSDRIVFTFDEYIDFQPVNQLEFTPGFDVNPPVELRGKTLTMRLGRPKWTDSLQPNTTYTIHFGGAIRDVNEGNVLRDFTYTFSTGPYLDSLELSGRVILAQTGRVDSTLIVVLHRKLEDSAVRTDRPPYVAKLNGNGEFRFRNLPAGTFAMYAIGDAAASKRYQRSDQLFAFLGTPVTTGTDSSFTLYAYREAPRTATPPASTGKLGTTEKRLMFSTNLTNSQQDLLNNLVLTFPVKLRTYDSALVRLATDSTYAPVDFSLSLDSTMKQLTVQTQWKPGTLYHLVLDKNFAEDTLGRRLLKTDTLSFTTRTLKDYGELAIRLRSIDLSANPVLQFVQNDQVVFAAPVPSGMYRNPMAVPGDYDLRILYDTNGDGVWTPGEFFRTKRQPELVKPLGRKITVKPDWENDFEITL
ncbi:MAG TPA: Ig-like domain-containing protein [Flavisolibacter sp.]